jgi:hypothetical protein
MNIPKTIIDPNSNIIYDKLTLRQYKMSQYLGYTPIYPSYYIQRPYNKEIRERYAERLIGDDLLYNFIIYREDLPHLPASNTEGRTEIRYQSITDYTGHYRFCMDFYSPINSYNHSLFQILSDIGPILQIRVLKGIIKVPGINFTPQIKYNDFNKFDFDLFFDELQSKYNFTLTINNETYTHTFQQIPQKTFYFKCGTYNLKGYELPDKNELFIRNISMYRKL